MSVLTYRCVHIVTTTLAAAYVKALTSLCNLVNGQHGGRNIHRHCIDKCGESLDNQPKTK